jgi:ketosteroid isomerase-like protein
MSQENVEIVRRAVEAFNEGGLEAAGELVADDLEFHEPPEQPAPRVARGRDEVLKMAGDFESAWAEHRTEPQEIRAVGDDKVLLLSVEHFRGRDGVEVSAPFGAVFTLRDAKIVRYQAFWDRQKALEAAGLSE